MTEAGGIMATSIGQIGLDLVVNKNQFESQMQGITGLAKKAGAALTAAFGIKKLVSFGKQCLELGSDLAEVQNVVDVTFPNMTAKVDKFAKSAAQSFGLSETMAKQYTGTFGAMAKAFGFTEEQAYDMGSTLTGLAGDVASFYNLSQDEAYTKIKSVFTGETESLKDLGVVMTQTALDSYALANGFGKTTSKMTEAEKVALRYAFVQDQLSAAQGDFARTSGSWANQVRILQLQFDSLKATIGQGLINLFTPIIKAVNTLIGRLVTLANAFKSFTELITGQKSSGSSTVESPISNLSDEAGTAEDSLQSASGAADNLSESTNKVGTAAKKAAKQLRSLMGFDQINRLDKKDSTTTSNPKGTGTVSLGDATDFGKLAEGDTVIDKTNKKLDSLLKRCKELAGLFKKGFQIGFGDSGKKIDSINRSLKNIGKNLKEIFTDPEVVSAANRCADNIALALGKTAGAVTRIGLTMADNLLGGVDKYLSKSKNYIKKRIVSIFDATGEIAKLWGDYAVALADIFDAFSGDDAKAITGDIIQIFADGFLGAADLAVKFVRDLNELCTVPIVQNTDKIKETLENLLRQCRIVFDTLAQSVTDSFDKLNQVYDEYFKPFVDSITQGISDILGTFLDAYNTYISPILDYLADKFSTVWQEHIQPAINGILELLGKVFENLQALWETLLVPLIEWIIKNIMPVLGPIIKNLGDQFLDFLALAGDVIKGITDILGGFLDFCTGAFTGDFDKCWKGIEEILKGFHTIAKAIFENIKKYVFQPFIDFFKGTFKTDWTKGFNTLKKTLDNFFENIKKIWEDIKTVFGGVIKFIDGTFSGNWKKAWEGIRDIFRGAFEGLADIAKIPINAIISAFNGVLGIVNAMISRVNNIRFRITVPSWVPGIGGNWWGFNGFSIPQIGTIPFLANGGYVKPNTPQLAMIGDNKHQGEVVAPEGKMLEMARAAAELSGGDAARLLQELIDLIKNMPKDFPIVSLDPETLRKYFIEKTNQNTKAKGKSELIY
jgi:phage-related protein